MAAPDWFLALPRPVLMAIGDSFLNGMRAYTIHDAHAAQSIPAMLAPSLIPAPPPSAPFAQAHYPDAILIDVEAELRRIGPFPPNTGLAQLLGRLEAIKRGVALNAHAWLRRFAGDPPPNAPPAFDNLAIAGAVLADVFEATLGQVEARIAAMAGAILHQDDPLDWEGAFPPGDPLAPPRTAGAWAMCTSRSTRGT
jgi:hypothetical protein